MPVTYTCNGIVKEFPIPDDETFSSVTVTFPDGSVFSFNSYSLLFMENVFTARGCVCFKEILPEGTTIAINDEDAETPEQAIERLDETTADLVHFQNDVLNVTDIALTRQSS